MMFFNSSLYSNTHCRNKKEIFITTVHHYDALLHDIHLFVQWIFVTDFRHFPADFIKFTVKIRNRLLNQFCNHTHVLFLQAASCNRRVPIRIPLVTNGLAGSFGTAFLFTVIYTSSRRFCISLPVTPMFCRSTSIR